MRNDTFKDSYIKAITALHEYYKLYAKDSTSMTAHIQFSCMEQRYMSKPVAIIQMYFLINCLE